jgi:hypothetical protein
MGTLIFSIVLSHLMDINRAALTQLKIFEAALPWSHTPTHNTTNSNRRNHLVTY